MAPPFSSAQARSAISASLRDWNATTAIGVRPFTWNESGATPATPLRMVRWSNQSPISRPYYKSTTNYRRTRGFLPGLTLT